MGEKNKTKLSPLKAFTIFNFSLKTIQYFFKGLLLTAFQVLYNITLIKVTPRQTIILHYDNIVKINEEKLPCLL